MLLPVKQRAHGVLIPSPQLHLGQRRGGCLHICKPLALFHTLLDLPRQRRQQGGARRHSTFPGSSQNAPACSKLQGDEGCDIAACGTSCRRSLWQRKRGPTQAGILCYSAAKESEQVMALQSALCPTSFAHRFFTPRQPLLHRAGPRGCPPVEYRHAVLIFNSEEQIQRL